MTIIIIPGHILDMWAVFIVVTRAIAVTAHFIASATPFALAHGGLFATIIMAIEDMIIAMPIGPAIVMVSAMVIVPVKAVVESARKMDEVKIEVDALADS